MITCPKCQKQLIDGSKFCEYCGAHITQQQPSATPDYRPVNNTRPQAANPGYRPVNNAPQKSVDFTQIIENIKGAIPKNIKLPKSFDIPHLLLVVLCGLMIFSLCLPLLNATSLYGEFLEDFDRDEFKSISVFKLLNADIGGEYSIIFGVIFAVLIIFMILSTLFALIKKPIGTVIFNVLSTLAFSGFPLIFILDGALDSRAYSFGAGFYIYYIIAIVTFVYAIVLISKDAQAKKALKANSMNYNYNNYNGYNNYNYSGNYNNNNYNNGNYNNYNNYQ